MKRIFDMAICILSLSGIIFFLIAAYRQGSATPIEMTLAIADGFIFGGYLANLTDEGEEQ